ncbi:hypothetical protein [Lutibacter sp.]|uniref:hypothetical protein n=1 Tax=Lutibacter sp. TaxID=1925666 RepID=UPI001A2FA449|nr:hypothetical protein [Lutibacter sp.]MBI9042406.1 hypothetical protein [Lutibacter sp.]
MSLKYKIYPEKSLLIDELSESITLEELLDFHSTYRNDENIISVHKVLTNLIGANFKMSLDEMLTYIDELKKEALPPNFKWAILTETPNSTMFSILIKEEACFKNKVGVFSTLKSCLEFLNIDLPENDFNSD